MCAKGHCDMAGGQMHCAGMAGRHCTMDGNCNGRRNLAGLFVLLNQPALPAHGAGVTLPASLGFVAATVALFAPTADPGSPWEPPRSQALVRSGF